MAKSESITRAAITAAATGILGNRTRSGACFFLNSHRDGQCTKCQDMARHDAELAA